ncbi:GspH/FimT family pseudopilin [Marinobacterium weihaiense]|uniref:GspH/FimT family pseudopilin n=1 Tax=Marinobacterium weihaiense TaxID=2851016 RepID=A0ABS6M9P3_9GAMM|nr:GspH/FimT family pseudopilin [Marinobacterium weihaiense]MBV0932992.1 GspH/FimT family pseudopilin [Marinobacterium weihaiense]
MRRTPPCFVRNGITRQAVSGFTLLEVMITVTILSIILFIGIPGFNSLFESARERSATSSFVTAVSLARSEALTRNTFTRVCVMEACGAGSREIRVEAETDNGTSELVRVWDVEKNIAYQSAGNSSVELRFAALGLAVNGSGQQLLAPQTVDVVDQASATAKVLGSYCIAVTGSLTKGGCQ